MSNRQTLQTSITMEIVLPKLKKIKTFQRNVSIYTRVKEQPGGKPNQSYKKFSSMLESVNKHIE